MTQKRYEQIISILNGQADLLLHLYYEAKDLGDVEDYAALIVAQQLKGLAATLSLTVKCKERAKEKQERG